MERRSVRSQTNACFRSLNAESAVGICKLRLHHLRDDFFHVDSCFPTQHALCLVGVSLALGDVGWSEQRIGYGDVFAPLEVQGGERFPRKVLETVGRACRDHEIARNLTLEYAPHGVDVFGCPPPIAPYMHIAKSKFLLASTRNAAGGCDNFACHEPLGSKRGFVVE